MPVESKKYFKVFRAGKYPQGTITASDIKEIAESYDKDYHEAPLIINHDDDSPAYAIVDDVKAEGEDLLVSFTDILEDAYEMNQKYKRPSVEITEYDLDGDNPKKYLRAVALTNFPQVKRLDKIKFDENSAVFFNENLTLNLTKGIKMKTKNFSEQVIKLAEKLSINIDDYSVEGDILEKAVEIINQLMAELAESKEKINSLNLNLAKYSDLPDEALKAAEAGITVDKFNELSEAVEKANAKITELIEAKEKAETKIKEYNEKRIEDLVTLALATKDLLPAQGDQIRRFAELDFDEAKKFVDGLPAKPGNGQLPRVKHNTEPDKTYEEIIKDPKLAAEYSEEQLEELRKKSKTFA